MLEDDARNHLQDHMHEIAKDNGRPSGWFNQSDGQFYLNAVKRHEQGVVVELGTHLGRSLSYVLKHCMDTGTEINVVDIWVNPNNHPVTKNVYETFMKNLKAMGGEEYVRVFYMNSCEAATHFKDNSVDLVFIDTLHNYEVTKAEINAWWRKLKVNGELIGHDYCAPNYGLILAVNEIFGRPDVAQGSMWRITKTEKERRHDVMYLSEKEC